MMRVALSFVAISVLGCATPTKKDSLSLPPLKSPASLQDAILTLPSDAVAGMSDAGRREYLKNPPGIFDTTHRRIELNGDNPYEGGDAESMLYLRLFEDSLGRTVAASHSARPFANGSDPADRNTAIYRVEDGVWVDVTTELLPPDIKRTWYFHFDELGDKVTAGPYTKQPRSDGLGSCYVFGSPKTKIVWTGNEFKKK